MTNGGHIILDMVVIPDQGTQPLNICVSRSGTRSRSGSIVPNQVTNLRFCFGGGGNLRSGKEFSIVFLKVLLKVFKNLP